VLRFRYDRTAAQFSHHLPDLYPPMLAKKEKRPGGSAQPFEKAHFSQENPRKSKLFSLIFLGRAWAGFAGFG
jgi:hypothetical protein